MARRRRPNYSHTAQAQARAEAGPQIRAVRRGTRSQVRALRSEEEPLMAGIESAEQQLKGAGLLPGDRRAALKELAERSADIPASISSQVLSAREQGQEQVSDLQASEAAQAASLLAQLQSAAAERAAEERKEEQGDIRDFKLGIQQSEVEKGLGLGDYSTSPLEEAEIGKLHAEARNGGLSPSERHTQQTYHNNAAFYAKQYFQGARDGASGAHGADVQKELAEAGFSADPTEWTDQQWNYIVQKVAPKAGSSVPIAERAVHAIRAHVSPQITTGSLLHSLGTVATTAGELAAPKSLQPLALIARQLIPGFH